MIKNCFEGEPINGEIIEAYAVILQRWYSTDVIGLPHPFLIDKLVRSKQPLTVRELKSQGVTSYWDPNILHSQVVFWPVCHGFHWFLVVLYPRRRVIGVLNSANSETDAIVDVSHPCFVGVVINCLFPLFEPDPHPTQPFSLFTAHATVFVHRHGRNQRVEAMPIQMSNAARKQWNVLWNLCYPGDEMYRNSNAIVL